MISYLCTENFFVCLFIEWKEGGCKFFFAWQMNGIEKFIESQKGKENFLLNSHAILIFSTRYLRRLTNFDIFTRDRKCLFYLFLDEGNIAAIWNVNSYILGSIFK